MDLINELRFIKEHFENVNENDLKEKLITLGLNEIQSLESEDLDFVTEKELTQDDADKVTYSSKRNLNYNVSINNITYNMDNDPSFEVA